MKRAYILIFVLVISFTGISLGEEDRVKSEEQAIEIANQEGIELGDDHWVVIRFLQDYFANNESPSARVLIKALIENFADLGGRKRLYQLFPKGPANQGCRIAGLSSPEGSADMSFGSVQ